MKVIFCEKPKVAGQIAAGLVKMTGKQMVKKGSYYEVGDYSLTWAYGHLLEIDIDAVAGSFSNYPVFPKTWKYTPTIGIDKTTKSAKTQLKTLQELTKSASELIIATDPGREGELIARLAIHEVVKKPLPMKRLWTSATLDDPNVVIAEMKNLKNSAEFDSLYEEALARQHADFMVGISLTRALRSIIGDGKKWTIGRVQTPVLCVVAARELAIRDFKPEPYWTLKAEFSTETDQYDGNLVKKSVEGLLAVDDADDEDDDEVTAKDKGQRLSKRELDEILSRLRIGSQATIVDVVIKQKSEPPPLLHTITTLQADVSKRTGMRIADVAKYLQEIYEAGYVSYPRTESKYLGTKNGPLVVEILKKIGRPDLVAAVNTSNKRVFDDAKLTDHHAIIPMKDGSALTGPQLKVYQAIKNSFVAAFSPNAISEQFEIHTECNGVRFVTTGQQDKSMGWKDVFGYKKKAFSFELKKGTVVSLKNLLHGEKMTQPPPRFTEASLLKVMENAHRLLPKEETKLRKLMQTKENAGLGTGASRTGIIQGHFNAKNFRLDGQSIVPEEHAIRLYQKLTGVSQVADPIMTAKWEEDLGAIRKKTQTRERFLDGIIGLVTSEIDKYRSSKLGDIAEVSLTACPACQAAMKLTPYNATCTGCGATFWKKLLQAPLSDSQFSKFLAGEKVYVSGMVSKKTSKTFDAWVSTGPKGLTFDFQTPPPPKKSSSAPAAKGATASKTKTSKAPTKPTKAPSKSAATKKVSSLLKKF